MIHSFSTYNHILENWTYATAAARTSASGFASTDVGKIAYQSDQGTYWRLTATTPTWQLFNNGPWFNASTSQATGFASDTYLAGSSIVIDTAGAWVAKAIYTCTFDMTKTAAGTAAFTITIRMGTLGTTGDASIAAPAFAVGTAAADTGIFTVTAVFRTVGSGTAAVLGYTVECSHHLAATGLITTGASGTGILTNASSGFASTTQTTIGISVNGGSSFSGTNNVVTASLQNQ